MRLLQSSWAGFILGTCCKMVSHPAGALSLLLCESICQFCESSVFTLSRIDAHSAYDLSIYNAVITVTDYLPGDSAQIISSAYNLRSRKVGAGKTSALLVPCWSPSPNTGGTFYPEWPACMHSSAAEPTENMAHYTRWSSSARKGCD